MPTYHKPEAKTIQELKDIAHKLRIDSINATQASKSGHPTSCASIAEIMSVLFFNTMRYKLSAPRDASSDRFILSKGHAAPILYAAWAEAGLFPVEDLLNLRKIDSDLEGHPTPRLNFIDVGTGSLGQGVAVACGMAYVGKNIDKADYRTYVLVGDGESAEGSIWESLHFAGYYKLNNLCVIFDVNRLGQSEPTSLQHQMEVYRKRLDAFGFNAIVVDGHDVEELCKAFFEAASTTDRPTAIIAKTYKGKHFPNIEDLENWHGKPLGDTAADVVAHLQKLIRNPGPIALAPPSPQKESAPKVNIKGIELATPPAYQKGEQVATRLAYGTALAKIAMNNDRVIALDGDTKNSTYSDKLRKAFPERFIECFIAEQNLVGVAIGAACRDRTVAFVSTFATFFTRAFDQIRMGAISQTNVNFVGSHCGVSIGEDGPSQMGLEDIAMFRAIPGSTVFYPADAVSTERAVEMAANTPGVCFIRTSRPNTAVIYDNTEKFEIGKCKVVKQNANDSVLLIGAGITLYEALKAAEELEKSGIHCRVIDPFTVKPLDQEGIIKHGAQCGGRVVVVEDHYKQGGLGEAVLSALAEQRNFVVKHLGVDKLPRSGPPTVLVDMFGISSRSVAAAVQDIIKIPAIATSMEEDTEYKKLPIDERCVHKLWKARVDGYEEAAKLFRTIDDEKSPEWNKYLGLIKKFVVDSNAVAQEKGLETTLVFVENSGNAGKTVGEVMGGIVTKCIGAPKTKTKELAVQITLMYVEIEKQETVLEELLKGTEQKNPKIVAACVTAITLALREFGNKVINIKPIVKRLPALLSDRDKTVRDESKALTVEIYRWIGAAFKSQIASLPAVLLTELDAEFEKIGSEKATPVRYLRSQQEKQLQIAASAVEGVEGEDDGDGADGGDGADEIDPMDLIDPVDILSKLPKDFYDKLEAKKWQERKESLEALETLLQNPKLQPGDYGDVVRALKKVITKDTNVVLVALGGKCLAMLAKGLAKKFNTYAGACVPAILEKFKEKKSNVVTALRDAIDAIYPSTTMEAILEDVLEALGNKNPSVKMETASFLARSFTKTLPTALSKKILKPLIAALLKTLNEPDPAVRDASADAIGTAMKLVGEKTIGPYLTEVDALKMAKIKECCERAVITVKIPAARKEPRPATAPAKAVTAIRKAPSETKVGSSGSGGGSAAVQRPATATVVKKVVSGGGLKKSATGGSIGGRAAGGGGKAGTTAAASNTEKDLSQEEIDERASELLPPDALGGLGDANWKTRLSAVESFAAAVPGLEAKPGLSQILLRSLAKKPGLKDTNFQVLKGKLDAARTVVERYGITTTTADYLVTDVTEKLGDAKNGSSAAALLTAIAEGGARLDYTVQRVMEFAFEQQKSPKVQQEVLVWVATALREFGFQVEAKGLLESARKAVQSINPAVRTAGIGLLGTMYLFMGQPLTMFFDNEKPALKQQIMAEFERCAGQKPPAPTRGAGAKAASAGGDDEDEEGGDCGADEESVPMVNVNDLLPRIDISGQITEALLTELSDKNWKTRNEGLVRLQTIIAEAKLIKPTLGDLPQVLAQRLVDSNAKIAQTSVEICQQLAIAMGPPCRQYVRAFFPGFLKGLGDGKSFIRSACLTCINTWGEQAGYKDFFDGEMIADALKTGSPALRTELYGWLAEKLPNLPTKSIPKDELQAILPHLYTHITDRSADVRKNANEAILGVMIHLGYDAMVKALDKQKPISKKDIQAALDKARPNLPVKQLPPPKAAPPLEESTGSKLKLKAPKSAGAGGAGAGGRGAGAGSAGTDKSGSGGAGVGSAGSGGSSSRKKEEDADSLAPLLAVNGLKKQRLLDEQKLKVLKWTFTTPREEFYELLKEQMQTANVNKALMVNMFHEDFRYHLKVIDALMEDLATNEEALICNLDLVMKWLSLRFYDTNPSVLLKGLEYLNQVFQRLVDRQYMLADIEGSSFVPHLLIKIGDPKDVVRNGVRSLLRQICLLYPFAKVFVFIMDALKSKNARQRAECLDELGYLIETYGLTVCQPSQPVALKEIARHISDRDNAVRNAALNAVVQAYFLAGEKIYKLIGQLSDKDLSMLDERIKRSKKASVLPAKKLPVPGAGNLNDTTIVAKESIVPVSQEMPTNVTGEGAVEDAMDEDETLVPSHADAVVVPMKMIVTEPPQPRVVKGPFKLDENVIADIERNWVKADDLGKTVLSPMDDSFIFDELTVIAANGVSYPDEKFRQLTQRNLLTTGTGGPGESPVHQHTTLSSIRPSLDGSGMLSKPKPAPPVGPSLTDALPKMDQNLVRIIRGIANTDSYAAHAALNELTDIMQSPEKQAVLRGYEEMYIQSVLQQFKNIQQKPIAESMNIYQPLLHSIFMFFASKSLGKHLTIVSIKNIISVLLGLMADNRLVTGIDDAQFVKVVNGICLKILDRTNFTYMNCALIRLLKESCQTSCLPKFTDLQMKCIWRNVKVIPDRLAELDYEAVLLEVHDFMLTLPSTWWQTRPSDMPLRTVKTIIHNMTKIKGNAILQHLNTIPTRSELHSYVLRILKNINKDATGTTGGDGEMGSTPSLRPSTAGMLATAQNNAMNSDNNNHGGSTTMRTGSMIGGDGDGNNPVVGSEYQKYIAVNASVENGPEGGKGGPQNKQNPEFWMDRLNHLLKKTTVGGQPTRGSMLGATGTQLSLDGATLGGAPVTGGVITDENLNLNQMQGSKFGFRRGPDGHDTTTTSLTGTPVVGGTTSQRRELLQQKLEQLKQHK
uniref:TOG domain-containing protein n=1 Tax=Anopheles epiroticus TaxID=199890 RepID=A0A182NZM0_9DIPT